MKDVTDVSPGVVSEVDDDVALSLLIVLYSASFDRADERSYP